MIEDKIKQILTELEIEVNDISLYVTAFTHQSYANEHKVQSNERLEYLGDAILDFLVAEYLFKKFPEYPEGKLTRIRAKYVCASANSNYALQIGLDECLLLGKGEEEQGGKTKPSLLGDLFEAFLGAIYLDSGLDSIRKLLSNLVFPQIGDPESDFFFDYKSHLQEFIQAESRQGVEYVLVKETGPAHDKTFTVSVFHDRIKLGTGVGKSKKEAEQNAAQDALNKLAVK
ncbi:MAG TPA: ribonuclease III [Acholeplasmataceae bacterium]|jgi:ribonuclease-3|nr:ribonuclease III [Acholeplasmataceae bacterium]